MPLLNILLYNYNSPKDIKSMTNLFGLSMMCYTHSSSTRGICLNDERV